MDNAVQYVGAADNTGTDWNDIWGKVLSAGLDVGKSYLTKQPKVVASDTAAQKDVRDVSAWDKIKNSPDLLIGGGLAVAVVLYLIVRKK